MNYEKQAEIFNEESKIWDSKQDNCSSQIKRLMDLSQIKKGYKVLDVGCGTGIIDKDLIEKVEESGFVKAIDISQGMINVSKTKFNYPNLLFEVNNIETIEDNSEYYNTIICNNVFPHFINVDKVLKNSYRLLKNNGYFIVSHLKGRNFVNNIHKNTENFQEDKVPLPSKWISLFKEYGFKEVLSLDEEDFYIIVMVKGD